MIESRNRTEMAVATMVMGSDRLAKIKKAASISNAISCATAGDA
jgi:hypothetical protein